MKKALLLILLISTFRANSQKLKDLLYSGKMRTDSNTVVRKSDDLSTKIDTATKKPAEAEKPQPVVSQNIPQVTGTPTSDSAATVESAMGETTATTPAPTETTAARAKNNTRHWKEYSDSLVGTFKTELLPNKKIKKDTYFVIAEYEIGIDGQVTVGNVSTTPENSFLQEEIKKRMEMTVPQLAPVLDSTGKARKTKRKFNFSIVKE